MIKSLFCPLLFFVSLMGHSQDLSGDYEVIFDATNSYISYNLTLKPNGRFEFHFYRKNDCQVCVEENQFGQGNWENKGKKLLLTTNPELDLEGQFTLDLNNSKAHFISKSPRDKTDRIVKTRLKFYESELSWVKGMEIFKK